jgi:Tfp pilus assembly protein PilV
MRKMKAHSTNARGFTLIETTIAMVVMMVVGLGATSLFLYSIRSNSGGEDRSQALAIAQQQLEQLRELGYNHLKLTPGVTNSTVIVQNDLSSTTAASSSSAAASATPTPTPGASATGDRYNIAVNVEGLPAGSTTPTQKRITVTVTPVNRHGAASWVNQNPVVIVQYRSSPATGPFKL